jgi:hypothetical protein
MLLAVKIISSGGMMWLVVIQIVKGMTMKRVMCPQILITWSVLLVNPIKPVVLTVIHVHVIHQVSNIHQVSKMLVSFGIQILVVLVRWFIVEFRFSVMHGILCS